MILHFMSQLKIHTKRKIAFKKLNLEHNCILQESGKSRDVGRDLFYWSGEITVLEIGAAIPENQIMAVSSISRFKLIKAILRCLIMTSVYLHHLKLINCPQAFE
mgnify:CR=1 FL=1